MKPTTNRVYSLCVTALFAAILAVLSPLSIPLPFTPVPLSLGTFAVYLAAAAGGVRWGTLSVAVYLLLGAVGIPVFAGYSGCLQVLVGPTGGYLIGYLPLAFLVGLLTDHFPERKSIYPLSMIAGTFFCYAIGTWWLARQASLSLPGALAAGVLPFLPGDGVKILAASAIAYPVRRVLFRRRENFPPQKKAG